jgi:hypothetical protein
MHHLALTALAVLVVRLVVLNVTEGNALGDSRNLKDPARLGGKGKGYSFAKVQ